MDGIKIIAQNICVVLVITGLFTILIPNKGFEKIMNFAVSLFFVCSIAIPLISGDFQFDFTLTDDERNEYEQSIQGSMQTSLVAISENKLSGEISGLLLKNQINSQKVEVRINIVEDNSINISNIKIYIKKEDDIFIHKIKELVQEEVGVDPQVIMM